MLPHRPNTRFTAASIERHLLVWSYSFDTASPVIPLIPLGIEIGVVLRGERIFTWDDGRSTTYGPGSLSVVDLGQPYFTGFTPAENDSGREVGFHVRVDRMDDWLARGMIPTFARGARFVDEDLSAIAAHVADGLDGRVRTEASMIDLAVRRFIDKNATFVPVDPLLLARLEIHRHFAKPLYMRHFAETAGVHPATFARKFAARFGVTPTRYRTQLRLQAAATLLATCPDMTVSQAAVKAGFEDVPYFHRAFSARTGATPLALVRRLASHGQATDRTAEAPALAAG